MCGIAGQVRDGGAPVERALVERMCAAQAHRGPDSLGLHSGPGVGLGIQRLRIIDLDTGDQPIYNEDRSVAVVLNGEIYNYRELRADLERRGHRFATQGDTEVIAHLYEEEGERCVHLLDGMFGFALWDVRRRQLLIARDRVGKKPLYYCERGGTLSFASELGALMQDPEIPRELDHQALDAYLAYGYVPAPRSAYAAVRKLPPAHTLVRRDGRTRIERYWRLDYGVKQRFASTGDMHEAILDTLDRAVRKRMVADVPVGAFLSGGVDSAAVVSSMAAASAEPIKTFSIGFDAEGFNELPRARRVAELFGTDHHELVVSPDAIDILPQIVRHYGEPFADHSAIACFHLARMAREHVTVALNGDGGDESFAGYQRYTSNLFLHRLDVLPAAARRALAAAAARLPGSGSSRALHNKLRRMGMAAGRDVAGRYITQLAVFDAERRRALYTPEYAAFIGPSASDDVVLDPWLRASGGELLDQYLEIDVQTYLPGDLLAKIDIATMAYSLEGRSPLLDPELMQLAASLDPKHKVRGLQRKVALRGALRGRLPDEVLDGPKRGFELPLQRWFRDDLGGFARDVLLDRETVQRRCFEPAAVASMLDEHTAGSADHGRRIWALLLLELWERQAGTPAPRLEAQPST
jgi:asparagine synthase (glutamine-hydrolysing)